MAPTLSLDTAAAVEEILDRPALLERIESDADLLGTLVELYESDSPGMIDAIRARIAQGDSAGLSQVAHKLKGSLLTLSAVAAAEAAFDLERMGREGHLDGAEAALAQLEDTLPKVSLALAALHAQLRARSPR